MPPETVQVIAIIFLLLNGVSAVCFFLVVFVMNGSRATLKAVLESVNDLNQTMVKLVTKDDIHEERHLEQKLINAQLNKEILMLREKYHNMVNDVCSKVQLLELKVETLEKQGQ